MIEFVSVEEARARPGLRVVMVGTVPSPWGEAAKGILHHKGIPYVATRLMQDPGAVKEWTGQDTGPIAIYESEKPRTGWAEILLLAERLAPNHPLLPADPERRALVFGLSHEICGEEGLSWSRRLASVHQSLTGGGGFDEGVARYLGAKYGYRGDNGEEAVTRTACLLAMFSARLDAQRAARSPYLVGPELTAADIYLATSLALLAPLPNDVCPIPDAFRHAFEAMDDRIRAALAPNLLAHRDTVYERHLELPLSL